MACDQHYCSLWWVCDLVTNCNALSEWTCLAFSKAAVAAFSSASYCFKHFFYCLSSVSSILRWNLRLFLSSLSGSSLRALSTSNCNLSILLWVIHTICLAHSNRCNGVSSEPNADSLDTVGGDLLLDLGL